MKEGINDISRIIFIPVLGPIFTLLIYHGINDHIEYRENKYRKVEPIFKKKIAKKEKKKIELQLCLSQNVLKEVIALIGH